MRTRNFVGMAAIAAALLITPAARAQDQDFSKVQMKVTKVSGNIYMLEGAGGNIAASVGEDGIVIVDDEFAPLAEKIAAALKNLNITDKPVHVNDLNATILRCMGIDHLRFTFKFQGLDQRLTGVEPAKVVTELLA